MLFHALHPFPFILYRTTIHLQAQVQRSQPLQQHQSRPQLLTPRLNKELVVEAPVQHRRSEDHMQLQMRRFLHNQPATSQVQQVVGNAQSLPSKFKFITGQRNRSTVIVLELHPWFFRAASLMGSMLPRRFHLRLPQEAG